MAEYELHELHGLVGRARERDEGAKVAAHAHVLAQQLLDERLLDELVAALGRRRVEQMSD